MKEIDTDKVQWKDGINLSFFIPMAEPVWQFSIRFRLPRLGTLATLGTIDVNANTRTVLPLSKPRIREIQKRANALVEH